MLTEFRNESLLDFTQPEVRARQLAAFAEVERHLGEKHPLVIGGERIETEATFKSLNPAQPEQVVGVFSKADDGDIERAVEAGERAFATWRWMPWRERAALLLRTAQLMREQRYELNATMVLEVGKSWPEADADLAEAIDFCEFYAREGLRLAKPQPLTPYPGELAELKYIPLGVGVVIPPWNFPAAILCGMTTAAVVAGNSVILKPSSDAPLIAWRFFRILEEAGMPPGVVNFLTGSGGIAGEGAARHPRTRFIAFTGSKAVGLWLNQVTAEAAIGQPWIKRAVLEMGGKDFIIVDSGANLDQAVDGVVRSAFGFQGQKCSACSRAIVDAEVYDDFLARLKPRVEAITVGPPRDPANWMGPVVNQRALEDHLGYIETGRKEARLVAGGERAPGDGYFLRPTVFADVPSTARLFREEIFGPVLAVTRANDFEHAVDLANDTEYGLTGGLYSRNRDRLARAKRQLHCGNLYLNRKITGALVGVHPFGGFNMSGTDSKAGGRDYLLLFTQAKSISEALR